MPRGEIESDAFSNALGEAVRGEQKTNPYTYRDFAKFGSGKNEREDQFDLPSSKVAPRVGLEPTTCGLTVRRATD